MHAAVKPGSAEALAARMLHLLQGYRASCVIATAVKLGLLDHLDADPVSVDELAKRLQAHGPSLRRLLRALDVLGVVESRANGICLAPAGRLLVDRRTGLRDRAILSAEEYMPAWVKLGHSVMTGEPVFPAAFGMNVWEHRKAHPELDEAFNRAMADLQARAKSSVLDAYDFSGCRLVVDVGGGSGALIADILQKYPGARGLVFDQPHVVIRAQAVLAAAGVLDRCRIAGGSFLDSVPTGGDVYILQYVLHDWSDTDCATILHQCRKAMEPSSALLVVENIVPEGAPQSESLAMLDLHMMLVLGGRERTSSEYRSLLRSAGLEVRRSVPGRPYPEIIVAARDDAERAGVDPYHPRAV
jgi:hypothetical protein